MKATQAQDSNPLSQQVLWISVQKYDFSSKQRRQRVSLRDAAVGLLMDINRKDTSTLLIKCHLPSHLPS